MENLLEKVAGMLGGLWDWTVHLNGGLQIVLVLLAVVMSGVCAIVAKRMQSPMMDMGGSVAGRTAVSIAAYVFGVVFLWTGNGVLDRFLEDESLFGEFLRTPVSEGGVESLVVEPPHIVVEVGA